MTVLDVQQDAAARTLTLTAAFDAAPEEVWRLWAEPRLLERWWGPPSYPASFTDHDLSAGGRVSYYMTGPDGERYHGWWRVLAVDPPHRLDYEDGFADAEGRPDPAMPTTTGSVVVEARPEGGTRMVLRTSFPTDEAMQQLLDMGMVEGFTQAVGQMDALLAGATAG